MRDAVVTVLLHGAAVMMRIAMLRFHVRQWMAGEGQAEIQLEVSGPVSWSWHSYFIPKEKS
jgi:hypothetical protein